MTRGFMMWIVWTLVCVAAFAQDAERLKDPKTIAAGHDLFLEKQCAHCHGEDGRGGVRPRTTQP